MKVPGLDTLRNFLKRFERAVRIHDYTKRYWGHDYSFTPTDKEGLTGKAVGWGTGLEKGDILGLVGSSGGCAPYRIIKISYYNDPWDMWKAQLKYVGRELDGKKVVFV